MKKVMAIILMLAMILSMSVATFANAGVFVDSVKANQAPVLVGVSNSNANATALVVTSFADKADLPAEVVAEFTAAYNTIVEAVKVEELNAEIATVAAAKAAEELAVSDIFDISRADFTPNDDGKYTVSVAADSLENFVCLLHYVNGAWQIVKDAAVSADGKNLVFSVDSFSPFAIVLDAEGLSPETSDNTMTTVLVAVMAVSAAAIVVLMVCNKKKCK